MAALLLRRLLLAGPTQFLLPRVAAAASLPTPPIHSLSTQVAAFAASVPTLYPHCPTSPLSTPSAASMSLGSFPSPGATTPSTASVSARTTPSSPSPATSSGPSISAPTPPSPSPAVLEPHLNLGALSAGPYSVSKLKARFGALSAGRHGISNVKGRFGAFSSGPHCICDWKGKGRQAQPSSMLAQNQCIRTFTSDEKVHASRDSSDEKVPPSSDSSDEKVHDSRALPVRQLIFRDDSEALEEEWMDLADYLKDHSLVVDATQNHLNMEVAGFGLKARYNLSEDIGIPLFQCLVLLALANNNRGYCVKRSFSKENLLVCPRLKQLMFKSVISDDLEPGLSDCNRAASYAAAGGLIVELLQDNVGPHVISQLLEEPRDLIIKLEHPSDERLIVYHPTFLSMDGRLWYYLKLYRLVYKVFPSKNVKFRRIVATAVSELAYTDGNLLVTDIIKSHPLLSHIESAAPADPDETDERPEDRSGRGKREKVKRGKKIVALHRHTIEHAFDTYAKQVQSNQAFRKKLWPYSTGQVVDFLKSVMPLHLLKLQEAFLCNNLWHHLSIDCFWSRDLTWIGGVPEPSKQEVDAIKMAGSYGRRRLEARKFDPRKEASS